MPNNNNPKEKGAALKKEREQVRVKTKTHNSSDSEKVPPLARAADFAKRLFHYIFPRAGVIVVGEKFKGGITGGIVAKYVAYTLLTVFIALLQTTFFSRFRPFSSSPDILILTVATIGFYDNEKSAAILGAFLGFIAGAVGGTGISLLPLIYMLVGYFAGLFASEYYKRGILLYAIYVVGCCVIRFFTTSIYIAFMWQSVDIIDAMKGVLIPEFLSTAVVSPLPALLLLPVYKLSKPKDEKPK